MMKGIRKLLSATIALSVAFAPMASANQYIFRYKDSVSYEPAAPEEEQYGLGNDITAWYVAPVGVNFSKSIPVATDDVVRWVKDSGTWPPGLSLDETTGAMNGAPTSGGRSALLYHGYDAQGHRIARARLNFTTFVPVGAGRQVDAYGHAGEYFYKEIAVPNGTDVYRWEPVGELPEGVTMSGNAVQGTPPSAGTFGFAWRGYDYTGREVAYAWGELLVQDGPEMDFIADQTVQIDDLWEFNVLPVVQHPINPVKFRLVAETAQPGGLTFDSVSGHVGGVYQWYDLSATYHIVAVDLFDGTEAKSNSFRLATSPRVLDLAQQMTDLRGTVGTPFHQQVAVKGLMEGAQFSLTQGAWPEGITLDKDTGVISGTPQKPATMTGLVVSASGPSMQAVSSAPFDFTVEAVALAATAQPVVARVGEPFVSKGIVVSKGDTPPLQFSAPAGLPEGVTIDQDTGIVSAPQGMTVAGTHGIPVTVTNGEGQSATIVQPMDVLANLAVEYTSKTVKRLAEFSVLPTVPEHSVHGSATYALSSGSLPAWLALDSRTGLLRGAPKDSTSVGTFGPFEVVLSDSTGRSSPPSKPFTVTVDERDPLQASVVNAQVERFVANQKPTLKASNAYGKPVFRHLSGTLSGTLSITPDGFLVGATEDPVGTVYGDLVYDVSDDEPSVPVQPFSISVVEPASLAPLSGSLDQVLTWTKNVPIPPGRLVLPDLKNGYGAVTYAFATEEPALSINPATRAVTGRVAQSGTTIHPYTIDDETDRSPAEGTLTLVMLDPMEATLASQVSGYVGSALSVAPVLKNAIGKVSWQQPSEQIPPGMRFADGVLSGLPRAEGVFPLTFTATDEAGTTVAASTTLTVGPALPFSVSWDSGAFHLGTAGTRIPTVVNALGKVSYRQLSGKLPSGLWIVGSGQIAGAIAGTPTEAGRFRGIVVEATDIGLDAVSAADNRTYSATIEVAVTLSGQPDFPDQTISVRKGANFTKPLAASNLVAPSTFASGDGKPLPFDLVLNPTAGTITGRFDEAGTYGPVSVKVTDDMGRSSTATIRFDVLDAFSIEAPRAASFTQYVSGSAAIPTVNRTGSVSYALTGGILPAGLAINQATGSIEGKAAEPGDTMGLVVTATDTDWATSSTEPFSVHVDPRPPLGLSLAQAYEFNQFFQGSVSAVASNVLDDPNWSIEPALPSWATFSDGVISGKSDEKTPSTTYTVTLSDGYDTVSKQISLSVGDRRPLEIQTPGSFTALMDYNFVQKLATSNALGTVAWRLVSGTLPAGLTFDEATGSFTGTPGEFGEFEVAVEATDTKGGAAQKIFTIDVKHDATPIVLSVQPAQVHVGLPLRAAAPTTGGTVGSASFSVDGLAGTGLSIDPDTGVVGGVPIASGVIQATITVSDVTGRSTTSVQTIEVIPPVVVTVPGGTTELVYNYDTASAPHAVAVNAVGPNTWTLRSGTLPEGVSIDPATGAFAGRPKALGDFGPIVVSVVDSLGGAGDSAPMLLHVEMNGDPIVLTVSPFTTYLDKPISTPAPTYDNELGTVTFFSPDVAALGLSMDPATGVITGVIGTLTDAYINVSVRDSGTQRVTSQPLRLKVVPELRVTYPALVSTNQGATLSQKASVGNNIGTITYRRGKGTWPDGITVDAVTGTLSATEVSAAAATYDNLTVLADVVFNGGQTDTQESNSFSIRVAPIPATPVISDVSSNATNRAVLFTVGAAGMTFKPIVVDSVKGRAWTYPGTTYALNHDIEGDTGLDFDPDTGTISGTATKPIIYKDLTVTVTSAQGDFDTTAPFWLGVQPSGPIVPEAGQQVRFGMRADRTTIIPGPKFLNTYGTLTFRNIQELLSATVDPATGTATQPPFGAAAFNGMPADGWPEDMQVTDEFGRTAVFGRKWLALYPLTISTAAKLGVEAGKSASVNVPTVGGVYGTRRFTGTGMPPGMTINAATGALEGTPLAVDIGKPFNVTVTVKDSFDETTQTSTYLVGVVSGPITPVAGQNLALRFRMDVDGSYSYKFDNVFGTATYSQPASYASVIDPATGIVTSKAPFPANTYTGPNSAWTGNVYYVTDALGRTGTVTYSVTNVYGIAIASTSSVALKAGTPVSVNAPTTGNIYGTRSFTGTGMPTGMTINPTTGALEGVPSATGIGNAFTVVVTVTDAWDGRSKSTSYTVTVTAP